MTYTKRLATVSAAALIAGASAAHAVPQSVIDAIVADLSAQGFARIEIEIDRTDIEVDAYGPGVAGDFTYTLAGVLVEADIDEDDGWDDDDWDDGDDDDDYDDADDRYDDEDEDRYEDADDDDDDDGDDDDGDSDDDGDDDYDDD